MNITQEPVSENHLKLIVDIEPQDYLAKVDQELKVLSKRIAIDGFRPGKVPAGITKKRYGNTVLAEELNKALSDSVNTFIKEKKLRVIGQPLPIQVKEQSIDINNPATYTFGFEVGIFPEFILPDLEEKSFKRKILDVSEEKISEEVDRLQTRHGKKEYPDTIADGNVIIGQWQELDEENKAKEDGITASSSFSLDLIKDDVSKSLLMNLIKEEETILNIKTAFGNDEELIIHRILQTDHHQAKHMGEKFKFILKNIVRIEKSELNKEFFDKVYGEGKVADELQMREKIKEELVTEFSNFSFSKLDRSVQDFLLSETIIKLPVDFLHRLIKETREKDQPEMNEHQLAQTIEQIKWDLIFEQLEKKYQVEITEEEMKSAAREDVIKYFGDASYFDQNPAALDNIIDSVLKETNSSQRLRSKLLNEKIFKLIREKIKVEEVVVDEHEFFHH